MKLYIFNASFYGGCAFATVAESKEKAIEQVKQKVEANKLDVNLVLQSLANLPEPEVLELTDVSIIY